MAVTPATPEDAAREILRCLQSIAGFQQIRLLVTGEVAVRRYFPSHPVQQVRLFLVIPEWGNIINPKEKLI